MATKRKKPIVKTPVVEQKNEPEVRRIIEPEDKGVIDTTVVVNDIEVVEAPQETSKKTKSAVFAEGVEIRPFGANSLLNPNDLTDELAVWLLDSGRATKAEFKTLPTGWKEKETK